MANIGMDTLTQLWNATEGSTWDSLLLNLDEIHELGTITTDQWQTLHDAIQQVSQKQTAFPDSVGELSQLLDHFM